MKIAFHITGREGGGVAMVVRHLANELKTLGHEIYFLSDQEGKFAEEAQGLGEVQITQVACMKHRSWHLGPIRLPNIFQLLHDWKIVKNAQKKLVNILQKLQPDVVIGNGMASGALLGKPCHKAGSPLVICLHGVGASHNDIFSMRARISARYLNLADKIVGVSKAVNHRYAPFLHIPTETIYNCPKPLTLNGKFAEAFRKEHNIPADAHIIGGAGRMISAKGHHVLIEAIKLLRDEGVDVYCVIAGDADGHEKYFESLLECIRQYKLEGRVFMPGFMAMENFLAIIDIFCHTYIGAEGLGLTILEAMQAGRPVIATNSGGPCEIIKNAEEGILISPGSAELLSSTIKDLLADEKRQSLIRTNAKKRIEETFNYSKWVFKWDVVLRSVT